MATRSADPTLPCVLRLDDTACCLQSPRYSQSQTVQNPVYEQPVGAQAELYDQGRAANNNALYSQATDAGVDSEI